MKFMVAIVLSVSTAFSVTIFDDFSDGIDGWVPGCGEASWYAYNQMACVNTTANASSLVFPGEVIVQDGSITVYGTGNHVFGVMARLNSSGVGVYAYLSIDHNVARIRRVVNGTTSTIYNSLYTSFPDGDYILVFTCQGPDMYLSIEHVQSSETWVLNASAGSSVQEGEWGLAAGETSASWHWAELQYEGVGIEGEPDLHATPPVIQPERNPFSGSVLISVTDAFGYLEIYDISGRRVENLDVSQGHAVFTPKAPGVYLVRVAGNTDVSPARLVCLP